MATVTPRIPSGFPEYLPPEQIEFNRLLEIVQTTYQKYGFSPVETPNLELAEVLLTKSGGETEQQVYRFTKGSNDLILPFDLTVPLARYIAQHEGQLIFPFRAYHVAKVHRGERAQAGRFREFYQCDVDIIGSKSPLADAELPVIINEIFEQFNFGEFTIYLNNRQILNGFFADLGLNDVSADVLRVVDKLDKLSVTEYQAELAQLGLDDNQIERLERFTSLAGDNDQLLEELAGLGVDNSSFKEGLDNLRSVVQSLRRLGMPENRFRINLAIARGLDYYTGTVYETVIDDHLELGSICSGGRYDNLAGYYTKTELPGVGISIGLTRLFYQLNQLGIVDANRLSPAQTVVIPINDDQLPQAIMIAQTLRQAGQATILYTESGKLKKKFHYADRMGFKWVVLIGEDEAAQGKATLKNMTTGQSLTLSVDDLVPVLSES